MVKTVIAGSIATAMLGLAPAALAQDAEPTVIETGVQLQSTATDALGVETPWYEAFTLSMNEHMLPGLDLENTVDWESPGGRWGVRVGIQDGPDVRSDVNDLSAGAFINLGDRFRLGGQVRLISPDDPMFRMMESDARQPEIKFESALRF
ncbi:NtrZ family periplasmic regulatory protein [uncultured Maricaulis sp.]|uniref:NtrZ family periplasmic regulatory protein n=1 Tax=uncultured Maricaulis sp. TaxID=174710 RepID=UPI0030DC3793|tara:strand:+ start:93665 stop:94114 length:450 start_codon:yes stop_codon:yes gene_type:complete